MTPAIASRARAPLRLERLERRQEHADERRERRRLHAGGHERGHDRRRPFVGVRRPHVERHGGHLEREPDRQQPDAEQRQRRRRVPRPATTAPGSICSRRVEPATAIRERDPVEEERARERSEQEVLERRFRARPRSRGGCRSGRRPTSDRISSATKMTSRSVAAAIIIIPQMREQRQRVVLAGRQIAPGPPRRSKTASSARRRRRGSRLMNSAKLSARMTPKLTAVGVPQEDRGDRGADQADQAEAGDRHALARLPDRLGQHRGKAPDRATIDDRNDCGVFSHDRVRDSGLGTGAFVGTRGSGLGARTRESGLRPRLALGTGLRSALACAATGRLRAR